MPRWSAGICAVGLLVTACGGSTRHQSLLDRRDAIRTRHEEAVARQLETYRASDGFQESRWGMSPEEVRALYPNVQLTRHGTFFISTQVADRDAVVEFHFVQNKLASATVFFLPTRPVREGFESLAELLKMKYGPPRFSEDSAASADDADAFAGLVDLLVVSIEVLSGKGGSHRDSHLDDAESRARRERAHLERLEAQHTFRLFHSWSNPETEVVLVGQSQHNSSALILRYESLVLKPQLLKDQQRKAAELKQTQSKDL